MFHAVFAGGAALSTGQAVGRHLAVAGDDVGGHRLQKPHPPHHAVAAVAVPRAAGAFADGKRFQHHREPPLQHFRVGKARVGHMGMHRIGAVMVGGRAGTAADGFVVLVGVVSPDEVVHGALGGGHGLQGAEQGVHQILGSFHVAGDDRRGMTRADHGAFRDDDLHGLQAAFVQRNVVVHQAPKHIQHRRAHHRFGGVEVARMLGAGAGEIHHRAAPFAVNGDGHRQAAAVVHRVGEAPVVQHAEHAPHRLFGVILDVAHVGVHGRHAVVRGHGHQFPRAFFAGRQLRLEVGDVHLRIARRPAARAQQLVNFLLAEAPVFHQFAVVYDHAFFLDAGGIRRR